MRKKEIDFMRGIAIIIMIIANSAPLILLSSDVTDIFRLICSLAAPLFVFLSGITFRMNKEQNKSDLLQSGLFLIFSGVLVDVAVWHIVPFTTFDVLYLIGASQVILYFLSFLPLIMIRGIMLGTLALYCFLFSKINYRFEIQDIPLKDLFNIEWSLYQPINAFRRFLIDGWFPLLPWMLLFGIGFLFKFDTLKYFLSKFSIFLLSVFVFITGIFMFFLNLEETLFRSSYVELFYPFKPTFLLISLGWISISTYISVLLFTYYDRLNFILSLGKKSLFVYIFHLSIISYIFPYFQALNIVKFIGVSMIFIYLIYLLVVMLETKHTKQVSTRLPRIFKKLLGI